MKTRLQSMKYVDGVPEYKGAGDVLAKVTCRFSDLNQTLTYLCTLHNSSKKLLKKYHFPFQVIKNEGFFSLWNRTLAELRYAAPLGCVQGMRARHHDA